MNFRFLKMALLFTILVSYANYGIAQEFIKCEDAKKNIGKTLTVCGKIFTGSFLDKSKTKPTLLNMGGAFPNQMLTVMIPLEYRKNFSIKPEEYFNDKNVCVTGKIIDYKGNPEIIITSPSELQLEVDYSTKSGVNTGNNETSPTNGTYIVKLTIAVNVRSQPLSGSPIITVASIGTKVTVIRSENGWSFVALEAYNASQNKTEILNGYIKNNVLK